MHSSRWRLGAVAEGRRRLDSYLDAVRMTPERAGKGALALHGFVTVSTPSLYLRCP